eukprot:403361196
MVSLVLGNNKNYRTCSQINFCGRNRALKIGIADRAQPIFSYSIDPQSIKMTDQLNFKLQLNCGSEGTNYLASTIYANILAYDNGAIRVKMSDTEKQRFGISDLGVGVEEDKLNQFRNLRDVASIDSDKILMKIKSRSNGENVERINYEIQFSPFRIIQKINGQTTMIVNHKDSLYFEKSEFFKRDIDYFQQIPGDCIKSLFSMLPLMSQRNYFSLDRYIERINSSESTSSREFWDFRESFGLGFFTPTPYIFGLAERVDTFRLKSTEGRGEPFRLQAIDIFPHDTYAREPTYSSLPYLHGHTQNFDTNMIWMTSAESFADTYTMNDDVLNQDGRFVDFVTETGRMEFFLFGSGSQDSPKKVQKTLADIIGYQNLPPIFSLGYHYSKWERNTSAARIIEWNSQFSRANIPVDVFWMDIPYTDDVKYFTFNPRTFAPYDMSEMKKLVQAKDRRFVVITDPHIKYKEEYKVFKNGKLMHQTWKEEQFVNIFVNQRNSSILKGYCWPGDSAWIDYFNQDARDYWKTLYKFEHFNNTDDSFHIWLDMNEPSVFTGPENTLPKDARHYLSDGTNLLSKDVKNAYGLMMMKATYESLKTRNVTENKRPFILTRSAFFGTQKYGAKWTGDNQATWPELAVSISQCLSLGLSGIPFVGADVPGFYLNSTDELYASFYQVGVFYPFFRAHGHIDFKGREPYLQNKKVQRIVRDTVKLRYDLIHYLYTQFYVANTEGLPIMRPLWYEFPKDYSTFDLESHFMYGDSILVVPKLTMSNQASNYRFQEYGQVEYIVSTYLPFDSDWYFWYNKSQRISGQQQLQQMRILDSQQGIYVRAGSILPIKLHRGVESVMLAIDKGINLEIYLDKNDQAKGYLYLDDGLTFKNELQNERIYLEITYDSGFIYYENKIQNSYYLDSKILIENIIVYGVKDRAAPINFLAKRSASLPEPEVIEENTRNITLDPIPAETQKISISQADINSTSINQNSSQNETQATNLVEETIQNKIIEEINNTLSSINTTLTARQQRQINKAQKYNINSTKSTNSTNNKSAQTTARQSQQGGGLKQSLFQSSAQVEQKTANPSPLKPMPTIPILINQVTEPPLTSPPSYSELKKNNSQNDILGQSQLTSSGSNHVYDPTQNESTISKINPYKQDNVQETIQNASYESFDEEEEKQLYAPGPNKIVYKNVKLQIRNLRSQFKDLLINLQSLNDN